MTFMKYPAEIRRLIYTTNPIEAFNRGIRKVTKTKTSFLTTDSLFKLLYLVSQDIEEKWTVPIQNWGLILNQLMVYFETFSISFKFVKLPDYHLKNICW